MTRKASLILLAIGMCCGQMAWAASPGIGVATARGSFYVNDTPVSGNATLFEGTAIVTERVASVLQLEGGEQLELAAGSKGIVYRGRLVLERGAGQVQNGTRFRVEAGELAILPSSPGIARIGLERGGRVQVQAVSTPLSVTTPQGVLVAQLDAGSALAFETQASGAAAPFQVAGCVQKAGEAIVLTDDTAGVTFQLQGTDLARYVGQRVEILGVRADDAKPVAGASEVVKVTKIRGSGGGCKAPAAAITPASKAAKAGKKPMGAAAKAVIAGVVVASAGAGAAIALNEEEAGTISR